MRPSLVGIDLKVARAEERLKLIEQERTRLLKGFQSDRIVGQFDAEGTTYVIRVEGDPPPLALGQRPWPTEADRITEGVLAVDRAFIKKRQPFNAGGDARWHPLAILADLNNIDKHRVVHAAYGGAAVGHAEGAQAIMRMRHQTVVIGDPGTIKYTRRLWRDGRSKIKFMTGHWPVLRPHPPGGGVIGPLGFPPSDDEAEIARVTDIEPGWTDADVYVDPPLEIEISLSDRERPMTIFDLREMLREVALIVSHFRPVFR